MTGARLAVASVFAVVAAAGFPLPAQPSAAQAGPSRYTVPPALDDGWATGSLDDAGIDRRRLEDMARSIRERPELNIHAVLIERDGRLVFAARA